MENDITIKENIRKKIPADMPCNPYESDYKEEEFNVDILENLFLKNYKSKGGFFMRCPSKDIISLIIKFLKEKKYTSILNTYAPLNSYLKEAQIKFQSAPDQNNPANIAIYNCNVLLASSGSMVFTDAKSNDLLFSANKEQGAYKETFIEATSIYGQAPVVLVLAQKSAILPNMKVAYQYYTKFRKVDPDFVEIVSPAPKQAEHYSIYNPLFILFLIS